MDLFSYLLGKSKSGGGGSSDLDWKSIGFTSTPQSIIDGYDYAEYIYNEWDATETNLSNKFDGDTDLIYMPSVDCSLSTNCYYMFHNCVNLIEVEKLNITSENKSCREMFSGCSSLLYTDFSDFDTSEVTTFQNMFSGCHRLKELDLSTFTSTKATNINGMFNVKGLEKLDVRNFVFSTVSTAVTCFGSSFPTDCLIIVKDSTEKTWINTNFPSLTNVKTVSEYEGS